MVDNETLNACDREPIHLPGAIQRFGALVVADQYQTIVQVSSNLERWLGVAPARALGRTIGELLGKPFADAVSSALASDAYGRGNVLDGPPDLHAVVTAHRYGELSYLEFEASTNDRSDILSGAHRLVSGLRAAGTSAELAEFVAHHLRLLTGFDRVMVYRFNDDGDGRVVAEALDDALEPFLGLQYPAADIPKQARRMYLAQRIRYIADVEYEPVPMYGLPDHEAPVDMTYCGLRSISPVHLEYLRNMGVAATLAMSLVVDDRLWGMVVCHHKGSVTLSPQQRALCDLVGQLMSALLSARLRTEAIAARFGRQSLLATLGERLICAERVAAALVEKSDDLLAIAGADGAYVRIGGETYLLGETPSHDAARLLLVAMQASGTGPTASGALAQEYPGLPFEKVAGALALPISHNPEDGILWFRQEVLRTIEWGGDPSQSKSAEGERLTPRKSFAAWRDLVVGKSLPWTDVDLATASELRRLVTAALLRQTEQQLAVLSHYDPLTGLPNRRALADRLAELEAKAETGSAMLFLDLDRFKTVNDSLGHTAGDELLVQVAERLKQAVHKHGVVSRLGGDEFVVLLGGADERVGRLVAARVLDAFRDPFILENRPYRTTTSIGMALSPAVPTCELMRAADAAMYASKRSGGSVLIVYESRLHTAMVDRLRLEQDLFLALDRDQFFLVYQPIVKCGSGEIVGVEALLRWSHPELGLIPPSTFIPIAEETGQVIAIGDWVMERAITTVASWNERLRLKLFVTVNVAPQQLAQPDFVGTTEKVLVRAGAVPSMLVVEVTESTMMDRAAVLRLETMGRLGIGIAIDDFGTGYSNLAYLRDLPADKVKIDRRFVAAAGLSSDDRAFLAAMVALARTTGMMVVAEGVETEAEREAVEAVGCDLVQGYLFGRPDTAETIEQQLTEEALPELTKPPLSKAEILEIEP